ncbi:hypothetical protein M569_08698, partial [Genlisea aurea]
SSQAGAKGSGQEDDEDLEDGFSELETPLVASEDENDDAVSAKSEISDEADANDPEAVGDGDKKIPKHELSALNKVVIGVHPPASMNSALDKWVEDGNEITKSDVALTMLYLRRRRMFIKALQLTEWLESKKHLEMSETNYASHLDFVAKVCGINKAEEYMKRIPESFMGEVVYRTFLANCVASTNVKKAEEIFNKMRGLDVPISCFSCNQMLLLCKRTDKKKIADVLLLMEKEQVKPSLFTYQILIDVKGQSKDINGMEQIFETMKAEGINPSTEIRASLARHYANSGFKDKAEKILKELEGDDLKKNRWACRLLLPIYASLGRDDEVGRIWEVCESDPRLEECVAAIEAWGQLNKIENSEAAFEEVLKKVKRKPSAKHFNVLLKVYANHKMLTKGKDLVKRMADLGCSIGPMTWDGLVKLYVGAGEVEKADSILERAIKQKTGRPLFSSFLLILDKYGQRGDIHNAEKIYLMMKQAGYPVKLRQYQSLLQAYVNAKVPAYGFVDRMRGDNLFPNKLVAAQLAQADAFRKSPFSELME